MTTLFLADPGLPDNTPTVLGFDSDEGEEVVFAISQCRSGSKTEGQDCLAAVLLGRWECVVLCDGHDLHGHLVSRSICDTLAPLVAQKLENSPLDSPEAEKAIVDAFDECERLCMWSNQSLAINSFVRLLAGQFLGRIGYVSQHHEEDDTFSVIVVDQGAYHRPRMARADITGSKWVGGSTCVCFIRDSVTNFVRIAVMGDTRALIVRAGPTSAASATLRSDPVFEKLNTGTSNSFQSFLSFPHDVFNTAELKRLEMEWKGEYEIDGPYLINPLTGCEIQPTRGFGDFDMFGTGYICVPDISKAFVLEPNVVILVASDGVFDDIVWPNFADISNFILSGIDQGHDLEKVARALHTETVRRAKIGEYVDDISMFMCRGNRSSLSASSSPPSTASKKAGLPPLPPTKTVKTIPSSSTIHLLEGVEGLPTPKSSFMSMSSLTGAGIVQTGARLSASLSEVAAGRRISAPGILVPGHVIATTSSQVSSVEESMAAPPPGGSAAARRRVSTSTQDKEATSPAKSTTPGVGSGGSSFQRPDTAPPQIPGVSSRLKRGSTADYVDANVARYVKPRPSVQGAVSGKPSEPLPPSKRPSTSHGVGTEDVMRRSRGPSFQIPEGMDGAGGELEAFDVPAELVTIGEDSELDILDQSTPADLVRSNVVAAMQRRLTALGTPTPPVADQRVNVLVQRMGLLHGADTKKLEDLMKDLAVV